MDMAHFHADKLNSIAYFIGVLQETDGPIGEISDGYHTFDELYAHRIALFKALCKQIAKTDPKSVWKSFRHSDGTKIEAWFVLGLYSDPGKQITYHLPESEWDNCGFAYTCNSQNPIRGIFDGHTSADVLKRLSEL